MTTLTALLIGFLLAVTVIAVRHRPDKKEGRDDA